MVFYILLLSAGFSYGEFKDLLYFNISKYHFDYGKIKNNLVLYLNEIPIKNEKNRVGFGSSVISPCNAFSLVFTCGIPCTCAYFPKQSNTSITNLVISTLPYKKIAFAALRFLRNVTFNEKDFYIN